MSLRTAAFNVYALLVAASAPFTVGSAIAESEVTRGPPRVPSEIIIYIHPEVTDRDFVGPLVCELEKVLVAPVSAKDLPLLLGSDLKATQTQLDATQVAYRFRQATMAEGDISAFKHFIMAQDITVRPYNYLFASTFGIDGETSPLQIISTARIASRYSKPPTAAQIALTTQRLYKIIIRSIVQSTGNASLSGCVMSFANSIVEHDRKSSDFCAPDRAHLVHQGVLREREIDGCQAVAQGKSRGLVSFLRLE